MYFVKGAGMCCAWNAKARQTKIHDKSQHFTARDRDHFHMNINPKHTSLHY
jgi:hypothetical protein